MKKILIACGNGIATSTVVATKVKNYLAENGVQAETTQTKLMEVQGKACSYDLLITTGQFDGGKIGIPVVKGMSILTGIGMEDTMKEILGKITE